MLEGYRKVYEIDQKLAYKVIDFLDRKHNRGEATRMGQGISPHPTGNPKFKTNISFYCYNHCSVGISSGIKLESPPPIEKSFVVINVATEGTHGEETFNELERVLLGK